MSSTRVISCGKQVDLAGGRIERPLQRDVEALLLGPRAVIGEIEAFLDKGIDIDRPVLAGALARMQQHVLDDRVGALAVLHDLVEIALQHIRHLVDLRARLAVDGYGRASASRNSSISSTESAEKLLTKLSGFLISWAMPAVSWPSEASFSVCTRRSCAVRRSCQRLRQFAGAGFDTFEQPRILDRQRRLRRERLDQIDGVLRETRRAAAAHHQHADDLVAAQQRRHQQRAEAGTQDDIVDGPGASSRRSATWTGSRSLQRLGDVASRQC